MFALGFEKIADGPAEGGHNNQGLQFNQGDTSQNPMVGPGGMAPSGIPSYQPVGKSQDDSKKKKGKMSDIEAAQFTFGKLSSAGVDATGNMGAGTSPGENAMANSKWDTDSGNYPQDLVTGQPPDKQPSSKKYYRKAKKCSQ